MQKGFSMVRNHKLLTLKDYYINTYINTAFMNLFLSQGEKSSISVEAIESVNPNVP